jgi:YrbI family 3-deoxy-D-manno-octulosonate 8-phosphate phosphatase
MNNPPGNILAVIPARAGSKGIPGKNLRVAGGKSLLAWSIAAARESKMGLRVIVSTDGDQIAQEARYCGAEIVLRPTEISGDTASSESALLHVLAELETKEKYRPDMLVFLQCTSPLTTAEDIDGTIEMLLKEGADSALAVVPFHYFLWRPRSDGGWEGVNHDKNVRLRRQDRPPEFLESGAVYVMRVDGFLKAKHRFFGKTVAYTMPAERRWEIDEASDLAVVEELLSLREKRFMPIQPAAVVFDFDGVMTDDSVFLDENGKESVRCDRSDGMGVELLRKAGMKILILSKERNPIVTARANKLKVEVIQGEDHKAEALHRWAKDNNVALEKIIYVGNDLNDLECLKVVGCSVAVADAHEKVRKAADIVLSRPGGNGAVRELAERILAPPQSPCSNL